MRVKELRQLLEEARQIVAAAGAKAPARELQQVEEAIARQDDREVQTFLDDLLRRFAPVRPAPPVCPEQWVARLVAAGQDEAIFKSIIADMKSDRALKKEGAQQIAHNYGVIRITKTSKASIIDSIEKHFYWITYNRDANEMARRATPW